MKGNGEKKSVVVAFIIELLVTAIVRFFTEKELPASFFYFVMSFFIIVFLCIILIWCYKCWNIFGNFRSKLNDTYKSAKNDNEKKHTLFFEFIENIKRLLNEWFRVSLFTFKSKKILFFISSIVFLCLSNPQNASAYFHIVQNVMGINLENQEKQNKVIETEEKEIEKDEKIGNDIEQDIDEKEDLQINIYENDNKVWRFVLDYPNDEKELEERRREQVFFLDKTSDTYQKIDKEEVLGLVYKWQLYPRNNVAYLNIKDELGNTYYFYNEKEDSFKRQVSIASQYNNREEWLKYAPHSSEIDFYINGRERLNCIEFEGRKGCYQIWWLLANDYQYYAQEYEAQTQNANAILYYYTNSIYCCMKALEFSISQEEYNRTYHYMVMRYHDIFREECLIPSFYKERAFKIYLILEQQDVLK